MATLIKLLVWSPLKTINIMNLSDPLLRKEDVNDS